MAKRIFTESNYILVDHDNGNVEEIPMQGSFYSETTEALIIANPNASINVQILKSTIGTWYDETGLVAYTTDSAKTFLRANSGFNPASGGSGAIGIADSSGVITYYDDIASANAAFVAGDVIQFFANINETNAVEFVLVNGAVYDLNGHTYEMSNAGTLNAVTDNAAAVTCTIFNGTIKRTGGTNNDVNSLALDVDHPASEVTLEGVIVKSDFGVATKSDGVVIGGRHIGYTKGVYLAGLTGYLNDAYCFGSTVYGLHSAAGYAKNVVAYSETGAGIIATQGNLQHCQGYSENSYGINSNGAEMFSCEGRSDGAAGIHCSAGYGLLLDCIGISSASYGINAGTRSLINCSGYSSASYAIYGGAFTTDRHIKSCKAYSTANSAYYGVLSGGQHWVDCYGESSVAPVAISQGGYYENCTFFCLWNNVGGHAIDDFNAAIGWNEAVNCTLEVTNASAYCLTGKASKTRKYAKNMFKGATTPVNATYVTQGQTLTEDTYGNIQIG